MAATGGHGAQQFCYTYAGRRSLKFPASALLPCCTRSNSSMRYVHTAHCGVPHTPSRNKCAPAFQLDKKRAHCFAIPFPKTAIPAFALPPFPSHHLLDSPPLASSCLREPPPHLTPPPPDLHCSAARTHATRSRLRCHCCPEARAATGERRCCFKGRLLTPLLLVRPHHPQHKTHAESSFVFSCPTLANQRHTCSFLTSPFD